MEKDMVGETTFEGVFVLDQSMYEKESTGIISILVNNEEKFTTGKIGGSTLNVFPFKVDFGEADSMVILYMGLWQKNKIEKYRFFLIPRKVLRPFNSRLDKKKLVENGFQLLPAWQDALSRYLKEMGTREE